MLPMLLALTMQGQNTLYSEPLRPQFHFTAQSGWLNDPNGLIYFKGEYHLFFQHNPFGPQWGNMTWGHAVSKDLVHWTQLDEAIRPDELGTIFSGSAVVDGSRISCFYTAAGGTNEASKGKPFTQCLATSSDGRTFTKLAGNPVVPHIAGENRDPKVIWYAPAKRWIMALYLEGSKYALLGSANLRDWSQLSTVEIPGTSECPDFFELPLDGDTKHMKWVFWGASGHYLVGSFDGTRFTPETQPIQGYFGNTGYAAQTYFNDPKKRRVQIAWLNGSEFPQCPWNQQMGFPTVLTLHTTPAGARLFFNPVEELKRLRATEVSPRNGQYDIPSGLFEILARYRVPAAGTLAFNLNGHELRYDAASHELEAFGKRVEIEPEGGKLRLHMLVDRASVEIFAQGGRTYMPMYALPKGSGNGLTIQTAEGFRAEELDVFELKSAWARK